MALAAVAACGLPEGDWFGDVPKVTDPGHLRWCNSGEPEFLDPAMATTTTSLKLIYAMFDGLTDYDPLGLPEPSLATSWDISDDQRRFVFHLRDNARWSNGRPVDAYDVAYQIVRVLHPSTASPNGDALVYVKNALPYAGNRVRKLLRDLGPFKQGDVVEIESAAGKTLTAWNDAKKPPPDSNLRRASKAVQLRDLGAAASAGHTRVPAGEDLQIVELTGGPASLPSPDGKVWAYVFWNDGYYGWVPLDELDQEPNAAVVYRVKAVAKKRQVGVDATSEELAADAKLERAAFEVTGRDLMMTPDVMGLRVPDPHTIVFETEDPTPFFISLTVQKAYRPTPREAVSRWPLRWTEPKRIITSGPMTLSLWKERDRIELVRSKTFWNQDETKLERLTAYSIDDQAAAANFYFTGGCYATTSNLIPASYFPVLNGEKRGRPYKDYRNEPYLGIYFAYINTKKVANVHLRRALNHAIDRSVLPKILHGGQIPTAQFSPGTPIAKLTDQELALCEVTRDTPGVAMIMKSGELCYVPPPGLDYDPAKAKAELELARRELGGEFPAKLTYRFNTGSEGHKLIAEYLQAQWQKVLGLPIELESQEWKIFVSDTRQGNYELARFGNIGNFPDPEAEFLINFTCESKDNRAQWCNQDFEAAMNAAKPLRDRKLRNAKIREAERVLLESAPIVPLYVYTQHSLQRPFVRDLHINFSDQPPLHEAFLDPSWGGEAP